MKATLLVELLKEELPPKSLSALAEAFLENLSKALGAAHLLAGKEKGRVFATPRRLALSTSSGAVPSSGSSSARWLANGPQSRSASGSERTCERRAATSGP